MELLDIVAVKSKLSYTTISSWDFSTLYTTIPHSDLKHSIKSLVFKVFEKNRFKKLVITSRNAFFSEVVNDGQHAFEYDEFIELFEYLIDNIYIRFGNYVFRQVIGIPMGTNCAPLLANLYLFYHEYAFLMKLGKGKNFEGKSFNHTFRFIDDLLSINNKHFKKHISSIYPKELELKETTESNTSCSFLDLLLFNSNGELKFRVYDKQDDFNFDIVNYPFSDSCIPKKSALGVYVSQLLRYARICSFYQDFKEKSHTLVNKLRKQGYREVDLRRLTLRFFNERQEFLSKYNIDNANVFLTDIVRL